MTETCQKTFWRTLISRSSLQSSYRTSVSVTSIKRYWMKALFLPFFVICSLSCCDQLFFWYDSLSNRSCTEPVSGEVLSKCLASHLLTLCPFTIWNKISTYLTPSPGSQSLYTERIGNHNLQWFMGRWPGLKKHSKEDHIGHAFNIPCDEAAWDYKMKGPNSIAGKPAWRQMKPQWGAHISTMDVPILKPVFGSIVLSSMNKMSTVPRRWAVSAQNIDAQWDLTFNSVLHN